MILREDYRNLIHRPTFLFHIVAMLLMKWKIHLKLKEEFIALLIELMIPYTQENNLINGRVREREFFKISPETAYGIFKDIAALMGDANKLKLYTPTLDQSQELELAENKTKRSNNSFELLNIGVGEEISFLYDDTIIAKVLNKKNQVEFDGIQYSVTGLARKILFERFDWAENLHVNGWRFFTKDGISLSDLRDNIENAIEEE